MVVTTIESDHKVQLPPEWVEELGFKGELLLRKERARSLSAPVQPQLGMTFSRRSFRLAPQTTVSDLPEVSGDDYFL